MNKSTLSGLDDDTLILVFGFLDVKDILCMRRTSTRFATISHLRVVWTRALASHVLSEGLPFPPVSADALDTPSLEQLVIRSLKLTEFWVNSSRSTKIEPLVEFSASFGTGVSDVRFLPAHSDWVITVTRGIWPLITCWDLSAQGVHGKGRKVAEWFRKGALFTGIAVNSDPNAEAYLAVSLSFAGHHCVEILAIRPSEEDRQPTFVSLASIETMFRAMSLHGDVLAVSDDVNETHIFNWRTNDSAILWGSDEPSEHNFQHNRCLQVLFTQKCVFVVRARSFEAFLIPPLLPSENLIEHQHPLACHRFGWLDGVAVVEQKQLPGEKNGWPPISILLRAESDDPWSSDVHTLDLYVLDPNLAYTPTPSSPNNHSPDRISPEPPQHTPYIFPPKHISSFTSARGHLRCTDIHLGTHGTALWIQPRPARNTDLTALDVHASDAQGTGVNPLTGTRVVREESLVAAVLPGILRDRQGMGNKEREETRVVAGSGRSGSWSALEYDEARGLVALGESTGGVTVLRLE